MCNNELILIRLPMCTVSLLLWLEVLGEFILTYLRSIWGEVRGLILFVLIFAIYNLTRQNNGSLSTWCEVTNDAFYVIQMLFLFWQRSLKSLLSSLHLHWLWQMPALLAWPPLTVLFDPKLGYILGHQTRQQICLFIYSWFFWKIYTFIIYDM
jgi:hypothetical protein